LTVEAIGCWQRAGQLAAERSANAEAAAHIRHGLELLRTLPESTERNEEELDLLTALGSLIIATKGHGHDDAATVYHRALDLCRSVDDTPHTAAVFRGLRPHPPYGAEFVSAQEAARELFALAKRTGDRGDLVEKQRAMGVLRFFAGDPRAA